MRSNFILAAACLATFTIAQTTPGETSSPPEPTESPVTSSQPSSGTTAGSSSAAASTSTPLADVVLRVPNLSVDRIELDVDNLQAEINLAAQIANLVDLNAGVQLGIEKVNITIADVRARLDLVIRLGHLTQIVNRTLHSLNLNPLLINVLDTVTDVAGEVIGAVDGLLGSIVRGDSTVNFLIDNLGNIVQEVTGAAGDAVSSIVGSYKKNMTYTGSEEQLGNGLTRRTYEYEALGALVNVVTNAADQVVQAVVVKGGNGDDDDDGGSSSTATTLPSSTATPST